MAAEWVTPVDEDTGLPLPIITTYSRLWFDNVANPTVHHGIHPYSHELLQDVGGQALRHCRLQVVPAELHNVGANCYHNYYYGPPIPSDMTEQFATVILAYAGYVPEQGIDFSGSSPKVVGMNKRQLCDLRTMSKRANYLQYKNFRYRHSAIRNFMQSYVLGQDMPTDKKTKANMEKFLTTQDLKKRQWLGFLILSQTIALATDPIYDKYVKAYKTGLLIPNAPDDPYVIVKNRLALAGHQEDIFLKLAAKCLAIFGVTDRVKEPLTIDAI